MDIFTDAQNRLYRYFSNGCWEIYDGVDVAQDAILTVGDIVLSVALNSRLDTRNKIWHIWQGKNLIEENLAKIPANIFLESDNLPWKDLFSLFESFCRIKFVGEAVTTKILHRKRPNLIPIYDSVLGDYFKPQLKDVWSRGGAIFIIRYMQLFRDLLLINKDKISSLCEFTTKNGWPISSVRALEVLIWIANESTGEYR